MTACRSILRAFAYLAGFSIPAIFSLAVLAETDPNHPSTGDETLLVDALQNIRAGELDSALVSIESVLGRNPNFRLAQLVYSDILLAKAGKLGGLDGDLNGHEAALLGLRDEARQRLQHHMLAPPPDSLPREILALSGRQQRVAVVDVDASRMYVFENEGGRVELIDDYYASTGKEGARKVREGDQRTPVGVYFVTGRIQPDALPDFYGPGALPISYPNEWDVRLGRTGYGIWIHGVPSDTYSRIPRASDGCVALANQDLAPLLDTLDSDDTPVIMVNGLTWVPRDELRRRRDEMMGYLARWRDAWESRAPKRYAAFYADEFRGESKNRQAWLAHKRRVNESKSYIEVGLSNLSVIGYPGERDLVVVTFDQDYKSNNYSGLSKKRQYWRRQADGDWRIVYEGTVRLRPEHVRGIPFSARSSITQLRP